MKRVAQGYDGDWEALLADVVGDGLAHPLGAAASRARRWLTRSRDSLEDSLGDYLREESGQLVTDVDVSGFIEAVHTLREDVDRLEARIRRLGS